MKTRENIRNWNKEELESKISLREKYKICKKNNTQEYLK